MEIETDCLLLYLRMKDGGIKGCEWSCGDVVRRYQALLQERKDRIISLAAQVGNEAADFIAVEAVRGMVQKGWLTQPPSCLSI